jgi:AcrR family transcriptional regulator
MRGFSDEERERIREGLKESGRELFAQYGLGKTTVAELTEPVGIGTSTFYQFYDSKDDLYRAILEDEERAIAERIMARSFEGSDDPREAIEGFLRASFEEIESNPLVQRILLEDELDRLEDQYTAAEQRAEREQELSFIRPYVEQWQAEGRVREGDPDAIAGVVRAVVFLTLHRDDIGENYEAVRDLLIEVVADGLVTE